MALEAKNQLLNELAYEIQHFRKLQLNEKQLVSIDDLKKHELDISSWATRIKPLIDQAISHRPGFDFISQELNKLMESFHNEIPKSRKFRDSAEWIIHKKKLKLYSSLRAIHAALKFGKQMIMTYC